MSNPLADLLEMAGRNMPSDKKVIRFVERTFFWAIVGNILSGIVGLGLLAGGIYVAWHFIAKWW